MDPFFLASQSSSDYCTIKEGVRKPSPVMPDARNSLVHCLRSVESIEKMLDVWNVGSPISLYALQEFHRGKKKWKQFLKQESWRKCTYKSQNTHRGDRRRGHSLARDVGAPTEADGEEWKLSGKCCWPSTRRPKEIKNKQRGVQLAQHRIVYHLY